MAALLPPPYPGSNDRDGHVLTEIKEGKMRPSARSL